MELTPLWQETQSPIFSGRTWTTRLSRPLVDAISPWQTLAENGIKHGIARLPLGGELGIATQIVDGHLEVEITNSGRL